MKSKNIKMKNKKMSTGKKVAIGAGLAAATAGAAYYLLGPNAKSHQKKAKGVFNKVKKEVKSEVKNSKEIQALTKKLKTSLSKFK